MNDKNTYDKYASEYTQLIDSENDVLGRELVIPELIRMAKAVDGLKILDAGCGEGRISRYFYDYGANIVGIDVSEKLITIAKSKLGGRKIEYQCMDLSEEIPSYFASYFDLIACNLVIDDVPNYLGFIKNICRMGNNTARIILSKNNPYSAVIREKVDNYFNTGNKIEYRGLASAGIHVYYYHRTLENYINVFSKHGYFLSKMSDIEPASTLLKHKNATTKERFQRYFRFPFLMVLEFTHIGKN